MPRSYPDGRPYYSLNSFLQETFGHKVWKISLSAGLSCPNRDGTLSFGGCTFCSAGGSGDFAEQLHRLPDGSTDMDARIPAAEKRLAGKLPASFFPGRQAFPAESSEKVLSESPEEPDGADARRERFIGYFQSFTGTYAPISRLEKLFSSCLSHPDIAGISVGTRPDCLPEETISLLRKLSEKAGKPVWVELGLQTIHEKTAAATNRGYPLPVFSDTVSRLQAAGLPVIVHVILGLPGETKADMLATVRYAGDLFPAVRGIKLQLLHILRGTKMAASFEAAPFPVLSREEYTDLVIDCLRILPEEMVIHRISGDGPKSGLIAPLWSADKKAFLNGFHKRLRELGARQGDLR